MTGWEPTLLVVDREASRRRELAQMLRRTVAKALEIDSITAIPSRDACDLVVINYDTLNEVELALLTTGVEDPQNRARVVLLSQGKGREELVPLFSNQLASNMLALSDGGVQLDEFLITVKKLLQRDIFGLDKYFTWGISTRQSIITTSTEKKAVLLEIQEFCQDIGLSRRFEMAFINVADELITNAIYNAPVDAEGNRAYRNLPRTHKVEMEPGQEVVVKFCCDGRRLGIAAADAFGSLAPDEVLAYLAKCMRRGTDQVDEKEGGAGLGFYTLYESLSHLIVNISPGVRTEVIGLLDITAGFRAFAGKGKSFNIFMEAGD